MIFIIIDKIKNAIRWIRWLPIVLFCPYVVEDIIRLCDINWNETPWSIQRGPDREPIKLKHRNRCDYDICPMVRRKP